MEGVFWLGCGFKQRKNQGNTSPPTLQSPVVGSLYLKSWYTKEPIAPGNKKVKCASRSVVSNSLGPHGLQPTRLLCPWDSLGKNTGVDCHSLLQGIFLTQELNSGLLHCRQILYHLSHQGSPIIRQIQIKTTNKTPKQNPHQSEWPSSKVYK